MRGVGARERVTPEMDSLNEADSLPSSNSSTITSHRRGSAMMDNVSYFSHTATSATPVMRMKTHMTGFHSEMLDRFIHNRKGSFGNSIKLKDHAWKLECNVEVKLHKFMETIGSKLEHALLETDDMNSGNMRMTHKRDYEYAILLNSGVLENFKCPAFCAKTGGTCCAKHHVVPEDEVKERQKVNIFESLSLSNLSFFFPVLLPFYIIPSFLHSFVPLSFVSFVSFVSCVFFLLYLSLLLSFISCVSFFCFFLCICFSHSFFLSINVSIYLCSFLPSFLPSFRPFFPTHIYPSGHSEGPQKHGSGSAGGGGPQARSRHGPAARKRGTARAPAAGR
jgi:hypothetical protein